MKTLDELWIAWGTKQLNEMTVEELEGILNNMRPLLERQSRISNSSFSGVEQELETRTSVRDIRNMSPDQITSISAGLYQQLSIPSTRMGVIY